ncbi:MAG: iron-containing alcohol dehydrogenase [Erysipelotrichaceae bacterium]
MLKLYYRIYQAVFRVIVAIIPFHFPIVIAKENAIFEVSSIIKENFKIHKLLLVTDTQLTKINLYGPLLTHLEENGIQVVLYDKTHANPSLDNVEEALALYKATGCEGIIAFGGGSPIDCAKGVAARVARPNKSLRKMKGVLGVLKKIPPLIAIPTTAGTGSETTLAAVLTNPVTHEKFAISDPNLFPAYAILDPLLTLKLPANITSTTGMDALTHAVEAYIGQSNTKETKELAINAVQYVFKYLITAYQEPENKEARLGMQQAAFWAGKAFTMAYVGNVHAIAHTLGGFYFTPHGLANAMLLPKVLRYYGYATDKPLAELADSINLTDASLSNSDKASALIEAIEKMNFTLKIPSGLPYILDTDVTNMAKNAYAEANPFYPVPVIFSHKDFETLIFSIQSKF